MDILYLGGMNFRQVSEKIMEQIIKQAVCKHLEENVVFNKSQHGFLSDKSCQTNLISFLIE